MRTDDAFPPATHSCEACVVAGKLFCLLSLFQDGGTGVGTIGTPWALNNQSLSHAEETNERARKTGRGKICQWITRISLMIGEALREAERAIFENEECGLLHPTDLQDSPFMKCYVSSL